tara:strand:- start:29 stop:700 length:672 start_codon:yes stop_codon:yes gene_type:complete
MIFVFAISISCERKISYLPKGKNNHIHYEVKFIDKEKKVKNYKQSYFLKESSPNKSTLVRNDGKVIKYEKEENKLILKDVQYLFPILVDQPEDKLKFEKENIVYELPLEENEFWQTNDLTTLVMKLGYDRIYRTLLPIKINNEVKSSNETLKVGNKVLRNCLKIEGVGQTSFNPGPPLENINIQVKKTEWYAPNLGLVKLIREETSDSETMGRVYYEKVITLN